MFCVKCGQELPDGSVFCTKCGNRLAAELNGNEKQVNPPPLEYTPAFSKRRPGSDEVYCRSCGSIIKKAAAVCPECGVNQNNSVKIEKSTISLLFLSIFFITIRPLYNLVARLFSISFSYNPAIPVIFGLMDILCITGVIFVIISYVKLKKSSV